VRVNDALRVELLERAGRDQAARESLKPAYDLQQWEQIVEPVDQANTARLRQISAAIVAASSTAALPVSVRRNWRSGVLTLWEVREPARLDERRAALGLQPEAQNRARLLAAERHQDDRPAEDR
jgi:hypothetical protein